MQAVPQIDSTDPIDPSRRTVVWGMASLAGLGVVACGGGGGGSASSGGSGGSGGGGSCLQPSGNAIGNFQSLKAVVTTFVGNGSQTWVDGTGTGASFSSPQGICLDGQGGLYVSDGSTQRIARITALGVKSYFAGGLSLLGMRYADGSALDAVFFSPSGMVLDANGNLFVADASNNRIRKINAAGIVSTFAGTGNAEWRDGTGTAASFNQPTQLAIDLCGNLLVADHFNHRIRSITPEGVVSTWVGSGTPAASDGTGTAASFNLPLGIAMDGSGNVYVADKGNHRIRKITPSGVVSTLAGSSSGWLDQTGTAAQFNSPAGLAYDPRGRLLVTEKINHRIRSISLDGVVTTVAGSSQGYSDGTGTAAHFDSPSDLAIDRSGQVYVNDYTNSRVRKITFQ